MKKICPYKTLTLFFTIFCAVPLLAFALPTSEWLRQHIDQRFSIEFPSQPKRGSGYGTTGYNSILPEASYFATAIHYNKQPHLKPITDPYPYYVSMLNSHIKHGQATLLDSASFTVDNYKGLQYVITSLHPNGRTQVTRTRRVLFVDGWVYQAEHMPLAPVTKVSQEKLRKFFDSMRLTHM